MTLRESISPFYLEKSKEIKLNQSLRLGLALSGSDISKLKAKQFSLTNLSIKFKHNGTFLIDFLKGKEVPLLINKKEVVRLMTIHHLQLSNAHLQKEDGLYKLYVKVGQWQPKFKDKNKSLRYKRNSIVNLNEKIDS